MRLGLVTAAVAAVLVLVAINTVRVRRRGMSVAETLRPHATELNSLQDDLLGRPRTAGDHPEVGRPVATLVTHPRRHHHRRTT